ncbi:MAG: leucine--tRNA ligase, partial [Planctomycetota bacterium]
TGAEVDFPLESLADDEWFEDRSSSGFPAAVDDEVIRVYTTRPDTLFGATYMVLAPEHPLVPHITSDQQRQAVEDYVSGAVNKSELERTAESKTKTGVFTGANAINPVTKEPIPIWVADYVMMGYGTGAIMAVPAHDTRDLEFARTFDLPVMQVVQPPEGQDWQGYVGPGVAVNSEQYNGMATAEMKRKLTEDLAEAGLGKAATNYKLRDWLFSRQRYWGEPFPIVHCPSCGTISLPESDLPVLLPEMDDFSPAASEDRDAPPAPPLGKMEKWVSVHCPSCNEPARRELNTMPQWAGSCWYYLRYLDPNNSERFVDPAIEKYWMAGPDGKSQGIDLYVGGAEHAVLHLLYARFWHKVLYDLGLVSTPEPFYRLFNQGMIRSFAYRDQRGVYIGYDQVDTSGDTPKHTETGEELSESVEKMSKSLKNVVNPDEVIAEYGADTFRLYEMFMGPLEASKPWNTRDVPGVHRFLQRVWRVVAGTDEQQALLVDTPADQQLERALHKLIKKVGEDIESMKFNTAIAAMMEFVNQVFKAGQIGRDQAERFVQLLAPFAPHISEELWQKLGHDKSLAWQAWPSYDEQMLAEESVEMVVQINGKVRGRVEVPADAEKDDVLSAARSDQQIAANLEGKKIVKEIVVPGRLVNFVVKG